MHEVVASGDLESQVPCPHVAQSPPERMTASPTFVGGLAPHPPVR